MMLAINQEPGAVAHAKEWVDEFLGSEDTEVRLVVSAPTPVGQHFGALTRACRVCRAQWLGGKGAYDRAWEDTREQVRAAHDGSQTHARQRPRDAEAADQLDTAYTFEVDNPFHAREDVSMSVAELLEAGTQALREGALTPSLHPFPHPNLLQLELSDPRTGTHQCR